MSKQSFLCVGWLHVNHFRKAELYLRNCCISSQYQSNKCPSRSRCRCCVVPPNILSTFRKILPVFCRPQHPQSGWKREEMIEHHAVCFLFCRLSYRAGVFLSPLTLRTVEHSARPRAFSALMVYSPMSLGPTRRINREQTPQVLEM